MARYECKGCIYSRSKRWRRGVGGPKSLHLLLAPKAGEGQKKSERMLLATSRLVSFSSTDIPVLLATRFSSSSSSFSSPFGLAQMLFLPASSPDLYFHPSPTGEGNKVTIQHTKGLRKAATAPTSPKRYTQRFGAERKRARLLHVCVCVCVGMCSGSGSSSPVSPTIRWSPSSSILVVGTLLPRH